MFERPSENLLFKAEKKNFFISSLILALYGITQIILMLFFLENLQFLSIFTFITGGLYFTAGVFGITSTKNNSLKLLNSSLSLTILLMIISFLIAIGSIILILLNFTEKPTCHSRNDNCSLSEAIYVAIYVIFAISAGISIASFVFLKISYNFGNLFKKTLVLYITQASRY